MDFGGKTFFTELPELKILRLKGKDRLDFLQRLSTQKTTGQPENSVSPGAFLSAQGTVISLFHLWFRAEETWLLMHEGYLQPSLGFLDKFHFGEDLVWDQVDGLLTYEVRGPSLQGAIGPLAELREGAWLLPLESWSSWRVPGAYIIEEQPGQANKLLSSFGALREENFKALRAWHLIPSGPQEIGESNIILEAPLSDFVHENKGCYPGQEVVERIRTYGKVAKRLVRLAPTCAWAVGDDLVQNGESVGKVVATFSHCPSQNLNVPAFALAVVRRGALTPKPGSEQNFEIEPLP